MPATLSPAYLLANLFEGSELQVAVDRPYLDTSSDFWFLDSWNLVVPKLVPRPAPSLQRMVGSLRERTGWSSRQLGTVVGASHTTVLAVEAGRRVVEGHSGGLRQHITDTYDVVERIFLLCGRDPNTTALVLVTGPNDRRSAVEELKAGQPSKAYLAAIDVLCPRPTGLLVTDGFRQDGATAALHD